MPNPDALIMNQLVSSVEFLNLYIKECSLLKQRALLKNKILELSRTLNIKEVIQTDYYMSLFAKIITKAIKMHGNGYKLTKSQILENSNIQDIAKRARKIVRYRYIGESLNIQKYLTKNKITGKKKSKSKKKPNSKEKQLQMSQYLKNISKLNILNGETKEKNLMSSLLSGNNQLILKSSINNLKKTGSFIEKPLNSFIKKQSNHVLKRQPFSMNQSENLKYRSQLINVFKKNFKSNNLKLLTHIKKNSFDINNQKLTKPLFLNPDIAKRYSQTSQINKLNGKSAENGRHTLNNVLIKSQRKISKGRISSHNKKSIKRYKNSKSKSENKRISHFPQNFIDWRLELKHNNKIKRSFDRLIKRGKYRGQVRLNNKKSNSKKKKQIHFYMLKKSNLVGENFIISSIEQNFLLKHIVLFSIVKNNLFYRLTKINFNYNEKDVNIKGIEYGNY
jgi:hypothetical protein